MTFLPPASLDHYQSFYHDICSEAEYGCGTVLLANLFQNHMERKNEESFWKKKKKVNIVVGFYGFTAFHIGQGWLKNKRVVNLVLEHKFELRNHSKPYFYYFKFFFNMSSKYCKVFSKLKKLLDISKPEIIKFYFLQASTVSEEENYNRTQ